MFKFLTGKAGTGKTTLIRNQILQNPSYAILASSTGISAINLGEGITTINSLLGYFDTQSLRDSYVSGKLRAKLRRIKNEYENIVIDECSMVNSEQLDIIIEAIKDVNSLTEEEEDYYKENNLTSNDLGLILVGDFAQLQPVEGSIAFKADNWPLFKDNIEVLTKIWRQDSIPFIEALENARWGKGQQLLDQLKILEVEFYNDVDTFYEGTTIFAKNEQVKSYNTIRLIKLPGRKVNSTKESSGFVLGEWSKIPAVLELKIGAYVMILANKPIYDIDEYGRQYVTGFEYVNGDTGYVRDLKDDVFYVELKRNKKIIEIPKIVRYNETKHKPDMLTEAALEAKGYQVWRHTERNKWILGEVEYHPLRLAYASTTHKSQGLTLDSIQIDIRNAFFGMDQMLYVALSRARTPRGLRLVATKEQLVVKRCNADIKVVNFYNNLFKNDI